ncbi:MAG: phosphopyruvate hydratase, partial [Gammaproteobacteria bacterium]|nr:phosphopyruvate hydratase [Gammaproteobacteria bacterium]
MSDTTVTRITGRQVWDSRSHPTVEAEVELANGVKGLAIAPAGASRGRYEAADLRDGGHRLKGLGVNCAVTNINQDIAQCVIGMDVTEQRLIDEALIELDGTPNKARLGGNAMVAVSMAVLQAAASAMGQPLYRYLAGEAPGPMPRPEIQIFGGGAHAQRCVDIQDFMVICPQVDTFADALCMSAEIYHTAARLMAEAGRLHGVADEGGHWPAFDSNEAALDMLVRAIERAGYAPGA